MKFCFYGVIIDDAQLVIIFAWTYKSLNINRDDSFAFSNIIAKIDFNQVLSHARGEIEILIHLKLSNNLRVPATLTQQVF